MNFKQFIDENIDMKYKLIDRDEFDKLVDYDYDDVCNRIKYMMCPSSFIEKFYFVCIDNNVVVGICEFWYSSRRKNTIDVSFVSVDNKYQNKGISKKILTMLFTKAKKENKKLYFSYYTDMGAKYIAHNINKLAKKYNVEIKERYE